MNYMDEAKKIKDELIADRRYLHENPELSHEEDETVKFITERLNSLGIRYVIVPKGGVLGFIGLRDNKARTVLLRADIDALKIEESENNFMGRKVSVSKVPGVAHLCGHDAHTAMLLGAARMLKEREAEIEKLNGRVILAFERAEEKGGCLCDLLEFIYDNKIKVDGCFAEHVRGTGLKAGTAAILDGPVTAGAYGFEVEITGKGGHGSTPYIANNPIDCFMAIYQAVSEIPVRFIPADKTCSFSLGLVSAGKVWNIIPDRLTFAGSYRYYDTEVGKTVYDKFHEFLNNICKTYGCKYEIKQQIGPIIPTVNNPTCAGIARGSARKLGDGIEVNFRRWTASESFSAAARMYPGAMAFIGIENEDIGTGADNHSPFFDIDENALPIGTALEVQYAFDFLSFDGSIDDFEPCNETPQELYKEVNYITDGEENKSE